MVKKSKVEICYDEILAEHKSTTGYGCDIDGRGYKLPSTAGKRATRNTPKTMVKMVDKAMGNKAKPKTDPKLKELKIAYTDNLNAFLT
jgi:hypothetical protein